MLAQTMTFVSSKIMNKTCYICSRSLTIESFYKDKSRKDGYSTRCKECDKIGRRNRYLKNKVHHMNTCRYNHHGITGKEYWNMFMEQEGKCIICSQYETTKTTNGQKIRLLNVDHNHKTGKIRGLLCKKCNIALGEFRDNPFILIKAVKYLKGELI